jgi:hypothetical protein
VNIWSKDSIVQKARLDGDATSTIQGESNSIYHEHIGTANKSDVSPNTPIADEADI